MSLSRNAFNIRDLMAVFSTYDIDWFISRDTNNSVSGSGFGIVDKRSESSDISEPD